MLVENWAAWLGCLAGLLSSWVFLCCLFANEIVVMSDRMWDSRGYQGVYIVLGAVSLATKSVLSLVGFLEVSPSVSLRRILKSLNMKS